MQYELSRKSTLWRHGNLNLNSSRGLLDHPHHLPGIVLPAGASGAGVHQGSAGQRPEVSGICAPYEPNGWHGSRIPWVRNAARCLNAGVLCAFCGPVRGLKVGAYDGCLASPQNTSERRVIMCPARGFSHLWYADCQRNGLGLWGSAKQLSIVNTWQLRAKARFIRIDGSTDPSKRSELVKEFQYHEDVRGAVLSIKAAGVGLTLTVSC